MEIFKLIKSYQRSACDFPNALVVRWIVYSREMEEKACVLPRLKRVNSQTNVLLRRSSSEISLLDLYRKIAVNNFDKASFFMDDK